jgi:hypothetical protein
VPRYPQSHAAELTRKDTKFINDAARYLENPTLLMEIANTVGRPLEFVFRGLDKVAPKQLEKAVKAALERALTVAVATIPNKPIDSEDDIAKVGMRTDWWHTLSVALTGIGGGLFGLPSLAIELPITTTIMLRSIAAIANDFGENLDDVEVRLQCLSVFAYGGSTDSDDAMESTYLTTRFGLQAAMQQAAKAVSAVGADELATMIQIGTVPAVVRLIAKIAARFDIAVTEKLVAQSLPIIGALGGATINVAFIDHFNRVARFHFGIRRLEGVYGQERIQSLLRASAIAIKQESKGITVFDTQ